MSLDKKSNQGSSSGKPRPPKPPLPGEDPDLIFKTSSRIDVDQGPNVNVGGNVTVTGRVDAGDIDVSRRDIDSQAAEPKVENRGLNKQVISVSRFLASAGFVLIILLLAIYFFVRDFLR